MFAKVLSWVFWNFRHIDLQRLLSADYSSD